LTHSSSGGAIGGVGINSGGDNSNNVFSVGDMVQILNDVDRVKQLQRGLTTNRLT